MSGGIFFWVAIAIGALLVLGAIGLVIYMLGAGQEEEPENLVQVMQRETEQEEEAPEETPESVFSMPGVRTVQMDSDRRASTAAPTRTRRAQREFHTAPTVARNSAPRREASYHELKDDDTNDFIPTAIRKPKPKAFSWEDEE